MTNLKMYVLVFLVVAGSIPVTAQSTNPSQEFRCAESHRSFAPKKPRMTAQGDIVPGQVIVQSKIDLDKNTSIKVVEYPRSGDDLDSYDSTVIVQRGQQQKKYPLKEHIKGGDVLRVVETAMVCTSPNSGGIFLAFEAGSTGAAEGFVVIQYSPEAINVQALPMANQGRIVVKRAEPSTVELWSASGKGAECEACKKRYSVQDCQIGQQQVQCKGRSESGGVLSPGKFMRARIEVQ